MTELETDPDLYDMPYNDHLGGTHWRSKVMVLGVDIRMVVVGPGTKLGTAHVQTTNAEPEIEQKDMPISTLYKHYRPDIEGSIPKSIRRETGFTRHWEAVTLVGQHPVRRVGTSGTALFDEDRAAWINYEGLDEGIIEALESVRFLRGDCFVDEHDQFVDEDDIIIRRIPWQEGRRKRT